MTERSAPSRRSSKNKARSGGAGAQDRSQSGFARAVQSARTYFCARGGEQGVTERVRRAAGADMSGLGGLREQNA